MKNVIRLACLFLALLPVKLLFAQPQKYSGFYITSQGDTVKGLFSNYTQWNRNPSQVSFVPTASANAVMLTPALCRKFVVEGYDEYLAFTGQRLVNPIEDVEILKIRAYSTFNDEYEGVTTFLRLVTRTPACELYVYTDGKRSNFYYRLPGQPLTELKYKKYFDQNQINEVPNYRQQLNNLFAEAIARRRLTTTLEKLAYNEEDLERFFQKLFPTAQVKRKQRSLHDGWVMSAGASLNKMKVVGDKSFAPVSTTYGSSIAPLFSVGYWHPFERNLGRFFMFPQLGLSGYQNTGTTNDATFSYNTTYKADLVVSGEVNVGGNLVNKGNLRWFLSGGVGILALVNNKELDKRYGISDGSLYFSGEIKLRSNAFTINTATGISVNDRILATVNYLFPSPLANLPMYSPMLSSIQLRVGYKLKRKR